jgi:hypothetical protein
MLSEKLESLEKKLQSMKTFKSLEKKKTNLEEIKNEKQKPSPSVKACKKEICLS